MGKYIWELSKWPNFTWDKDLVASKLLEAKKSQAYILAQATFFESEDEVELLTEEAFTTSAIEGEKLDKESIRSSALRRLGLPLKNKAKIKQNTDALVEILLDATQNHDLPLTNKRLYSWQAALFPSGFSGMNKIKVGSFRTTKEPMRVISGPLGQETTHFLAPPSSQVKEEMTSFITWWNKDSSSLDGILKAAIAHLWFVTIHPFEDGNGRLARLLSDMALASDEKTQRRFYSLSAQIIKDKKTYYDILESTQKGNGDITKWLTWFMATFIESIENSKQLVSKSLFIARFYKEHSSKDLNVRQWKVLKKLLEQYPSLFEGGLTNKKYVSITGTSPETAKRDLKELLEKKILILGEGKGRSTNYQLNISFQSS